jgi:hypothetical protein
MTTTSSLSPSATAEGNSWVGGSVGCLLYICCCCRRSTPSALSLGAAGRWGVCTSASHRRSMRVR